jgi:hypothetical protein
MATLDLTMTRFGLRPRYFSGASIRTITNTMPEETDGPECDEPDLTNDGEDE